MLQDSASPVYRGSSDVRAIPQFVNLSNFIHDVDSKKGKQKQLNEKEITRLQNLTDDLLGVIDKKNRAEIFPLLKRSFSMISNNTPIDKMVNDDSDPIMSNDSSNSVENVEPGPVSIQKNRSDDSSYWKEQIRRIQTESTEAIEQLKKKMALKVLKITQLKEEVDYLQNQLTEKDQIIVKQENKIAKLEDLFYDTDKKVQELNNIVEHHNDVEKDLSDNIKEIEELRMENEELKSQNEKLLKFIDEIGNEYSKYTPQIQSLSSQKEQLANCVYKLLNFTQKLPNPRKETQNQINSQDLSNLIDKINSNVQIDEIETINSKDLPEIRKLQEMTDVIIHKYNENTKSKSIEASKQKLSDIIFAQLRFINELANSNHPDSIVISSVHEDQLKELVESSCQNIQKFLEANNIKMTHETSQFTDLIDIAGDIAISDDLGQFIYTMKNNIIVSDEERMAFVLQLATANNILRRYAQESKKMLEYLSNQNKYLKQSQNKPENVKKHDKAVQIYQNIDNSSEKLQNVLKILQQCKRTAQSRDTINVVNNIISYITTDAEIPDDSAYVKKLENKIQFQKVKYADTMKKYKNIILELEKKLDQDMEDIKLQKSEISSLQNQIEALKQDNSAKDRSHKEEIDTLNQKLLQKNKEIRSQTDSIIKMQEEMKNERFNLKRNYIKALCEIKQQVQSINQQFEGILEFLPTIFNIYHKNVKINTVYIQKSYDNVILAQNEEKENLMNEIEQNKIESKNLSDELERAVTLAGTSGENVAQLQQKLRSTEQKLKFSEERHKSDTILLKKQFEFQLNSKDVLIAQKEEKFKDEYNRLLLETYAKICRGFKEFYDVSKPISEETIEFIIKSVNEKLSQFNEMKQKTLNAEVEIESIKKCLPDSTQSISETVTKMAEQIKELQEKYKVVLSEKERIGYDVKMLPKYKEAYSNLRDWEIWGKRVISLIPYNKFESSSNSVEIRNQIEKYVNSRAHEKVSAPPEAPAQPLFARYLLT